jgi:REP element-mobilizing transposase RayT
MPRVTPPRYIIKGQTLFVTLRAVGRSFRFLPTRAVNEIIRYALAVTAEQYGIALHEFKFMSNHGHILLTDVEGRLPDFMRDLNSLISRQLNAHRGHRGTNIEKGYNAVAPQDDEKVLDHAVYTLANACSAHLVKRTRHWKGVSSFGMKYGEVVLVPRPKVGMWKHEDADRQDTPRRKHGQNPNRAGRRCRSKLPEQAKLVLVRPNVMEHLSDDELRAQILERLDARERELIQERKRTGKKVMGMKAVLAQDWQSSPRSKEDLFRTTPSFSGRSKWARIEAAQRRRTFLERHAQARTAFNAGTRDVEFPYGTWLMRRRHNVRCACAPPT